MDGLVCQVSTDVQLFGDAVVDGGQGPTVD